VAKDPPSQGAGGPATLMGRQRPIPGGCRKGRFDGMQGRRLAGAIASEFYRALGRRGSLLIGYKSSGAPKPSDGRHPEWWRQGMMGGGQNAHYDGIVAFSGRPIYEDLKTTPVHVLVMHGDDGPESFPMPDSAPLRAKLLKERHAEGPNKGFPHGMPNTEATTDYKTPDSAGVHQELSYSHATCHFRARCRLGG